ncbi:MAG: nuclear transport factor 2 family protein [Sphingomonadales bacterium]|nr:nuclear transport factor 2 family protein [Sphingomonadales bacterium]
MLLSLFAAAALAAAPLPAASPDPDRVAIDALVEDFRQAVINRNGRALSELMVDPLIPFLQIDGQEGVDRRRRYNARYQGFDIPGFPGFARMITESKVPVEERFANIAVRTDGPMGMVTFDYQFIEDGKISNVGLEHWVLRKIDGRWKILSVTWTSRAP